MRTVTSCTLNCGDTCSLIVEAPARHKPELARVSANPDHPCTQGLCCAKVRGHAARLSHPRRVTEPLLRHGDGFRAVSWDQALDLCAGRLEALRRRPETVLHVHGHGHRGVLAKASDWFFAHYGAANTWGSPCDEAGVAAGELDFGVLEHNDPRCLARAGRIVLWGRDVYSSSIHTAKWVQEARRAGAEVLRITVGADGNAPLAGRGVRVRPGGDRFLALAVLRLLLERDRLDSRAVARCAGWEPFRDVLQGLDAEDMARRADASLEDAAFLADWYGGDAPVATVIGWGVQRRTRGGEAVRLLDALAMLSGNVGRGEAGIYFNMGSMRHFALGMDAWPERPRRFLEPRLGQEMLAADPPLEMVWVEGLNAVTQLPESRSIARALRECPFTVAVEAFMTDTAREADLILPPQLMFEREEVVGSNLHHCVNYAAPVFAPAGQARDNYDMVAALGARLDPALALPDRDTWLADALEPLGGARALDRLRTEGFVETPFRETAFADLRFGHPDGRYHLPEAVHLEPDPAHPEYPQALLTLLRRDRMHSQADPGLEREVPVVEAAPDSPALEGLDPEADVYLATPLGRLRVVLKIVPGLHPDALVCRRGGWLAHGAGVNELCQGLVADLGGNAASYDQPCRLENG
jgi:anaerobic selenocysteine-containing dehydrogenase